MNNFEHEVAERISANALNHELKHASREFMKASTLPKYCYNFSWLGRPIIQYPQDIVASQELIWKIRPDLIIETGIAHGGSLILSAAILAMLDLAEAQANGSTLDPNRPSRRVLGIDIDIRAHNREAIEQHPLHPYIEMIEGSSIEDSVVSQVKLKAAASKRVLVFLDSNHTHDHVLAELKAYAPLTSVGSYCVVFDTIIEDLPAGTYKNRPWDVGNNPKTAVHDYLSGNSDFEIDEQMDNKLLVSVNPHGFLRRVR
jgi:cephalosporin hydroxylase